MIYDIDTLIRDVSARVGEMADEVALMVESRLPEVGERLLREAPMEMLGQGEELDAEVTARLMPCGLYAAEISLPEDFVRLVSVRLEGWERSVCRVTGYDSIGSDCQWSAEPGIAGCPERPRCYLDMAGGLVLRLVGSEKVPVVSELRVWRLPMAPSFYFPPLLYPRLVAEIGKMI